jgi:hypothetical protein
VTAYWRRALEECEIRLGLAGGDLGAYEDGRIVVNRGKRYPAWFKVKVLLHECLHHCHPLENEQRILEREEIEWQRLKPSDLRALHEALWGLPVPRAGGKGCTASASGGTKETGP